MWMWSEMDEDSGCKQIILQRVTNNPLSQTKTSLNRIKRYVQVIQTCQTCFLWHRRYNYVKLRALHYNMVSLEILYCFESAVPKHSCKPWNWYFSVSKISYLSWLQLVEASMLLPSTSKSQLQNPLLLSVLSVWQQFHHRSRIRGNED